MQWSKPGAPLLLQTRVQTLDGALGAIFKRWYPDMDIEVEETNPAMTSFTPVRHSADWIVASPNLLFRRAIHGSKCYRVLHLGVFWDIDDHARRCTAVDEMSPGPMLPCLHPFEEPQWLRRKRQSRLMPSRLRSVQYQRCLRIEGEQRSLG
jgi:hypothetical protein